RLTAGLPFRWPPSRFKCKLYAPWILARVCSHWRSIVKADPSLWNNALLLFDPWNGIEVKSITWWMQNLIVPDHPITLTTLTANGISIHSDIHDAVLDPLSPWISHLTMDNVDDFLRMSVNSLTRVENLFLNLSKRHYDAMSFSSPSCPMDQLRLFKVNFRYDFHEYFMRNVPIPWHTLTHFVISFANHGDFQIISITSALEVLRKCTSLETCSIEVAASREPISAVTVELPLLSSLTVTHFQEDSDYHYSLFESLVTPMLKHLDLSKLRTAINKFDLHPNLGAFVHRSGCQLRTLTIKGSHIALTDFDLKSLSSLHILKVPEIEFSAETLRQVAEGILLPQVTQFEYLQTSS
ncbi:hypothetical protein H0H93_009913, partial [Arthromyces matolae]